MMDTTFSRWTLSTLRGLAQVAFADSWAAGLLVLAAIAAVVPWGALAALIGAIAGTVAGRLHPTLGDAEWNAGVAGANPAIVGILWGIAYSTGFASVSVLVLALLSCIGIEFVCRPLMAKVRLPMLSAPSMATAYLVAAIYSGFGDSFWRHTVVFPFGETGIVVAVILVGLATATKSRIATVQTAVLAGIAALASGWLVGAGGFGAVGLWAFTVAPAAFGVHAVFLAGSGAGAWAGLAAAVLASLVWVLWVSSPLIDVAPPLLVPFIVSVWAVVGFLARLKGPLIFDPTVWAVARAIREARSRGQPVLTLTGAGISTDSGIPDYVSGSWLKPDVPVSAYSYDRFLTSSRCRFEYWDACNSFRKLAAEASPNPGHFALASMERNGWLTSTITQNVDGLHQMAGSQAVIELHGRIHQVRCLSCGWSGDWPPVEIWRRYDIRCRHCSGLLKPYVIAMGEDIPPPAWKAAEDLVKGCGVMLVVGSRLAISSALELIARARQANGTMAMVVLEPLPQFVAADDFVLTLKAEEVLPALAFLLDCPPTESRILDPQ